MQCRLVLPICKNIAKRYRMSRFHNQILKRPQNASSQLMSKTKSALLQLSLRGRSRRGRRCQRSRRDQIHRHDYPHQRQHYPDPKLKTVLHLRSPQTMLYHNSDQGRSQSSLTHRRFPVALTSISNSVPGITILMLTVAPNAAPNSFSHFLPTSAT